MLDRKVVILIVMLICTILKTHATNQTVFSKDFKKQWNHAYPFSTNNKLCYVVRDHHTISLKSDEPLHKSCSITFDPTITIGRISAHPLGNGRIVVYRWKNAATKFYIINPGHCSADAMVRISNKKYIQLFKDRLGALVTYNDTFDVFDYNQHHCTPCRYNYKGDLVESPSNLMPELESKDGKTTDGLHNGFFLSTIKDKDPSQGYLYGFKFNNGTTVLKLLNSSYEVLKQRLVNHTIDTYSVSYGWMSICYMPKNAPVTGVLLNNETTWQYVMCELLDEELKSKQIVRMYEPKNGIHTTMPKIHNLPDGGAVVSMVFKKNSTKIVKDFEVIVQRIHTDGETSEPIEFDKVSCESLNVFNFVLKEGRYCSVIVFDKLLAEGHVHTKCTDAFK